MTARAPHAVGFAALTLLLVAAGLPRAAAEPLSLTIPAFAQGQPIPLEHTCSGANRSPALTWSGDVAGVKSFTLIVEDPDAPGGTFVHWLAWDLGAKARSLPAGVPGNDVIPGTGGARQGRNGFGLLGYRGPCPPKGHGVHRYVFKLLALDVAGLGLPPASSHDQVEDAARGHVLATATYTGTFERGP
ncbi:MAG: YbhB/YbcL family Raf kinase inhibitor-like protein [Deltaproteobacteria bacterium]|nr:YbhB/YbcL family Raf kinase inhibitor-like protein [Deltaproteobacteria bacterium]